MAPRSALGVAVADGDGRILHADPTFYRWFGRDSESLAVRKLVREALKEGQVTGLLGAIDGAAIPACAGVREETSGWPMPAEFQIALQAGPRRVVILCFAPSRAAASASSCSN